MKAFFASDQASEVVIEARKMLKEKFMKDTRQEMADLVKTALERGLEVAQLTTFLKEAVTASVMNS
jgi:hypothetical protein